MSPSATKAGPKDVFLHLLLILFLYAVVFHFGTLLFQMIDMAFPDLLHGDYGRWARAGLRWPLATLTVIFPLYVWLTVFLQRDIKAHPGKRELKSRKWLLSFTLFLAAIIIVGDLIALLHRFLNGDLTVRFILKVIVVLLLALSVFLYYGWTLKRSDTPSSHPAMRLFVWATIAAGGMSVVAGFLLVGSPVAERLRQFDDRRVSDLQSLQWEVVNFWQAKEQLPGSLEALRDDIRGFIPPRDPETGQTYEYRIFTPLSFELCAAFRMDSENEGGAVRAVPIPRGPYGEAVESFAHGAGRTCFMRTIDPDRYPPHLKEVPR